MNLTVFTDASLCTRTGAAGWGAWAKRNDWSAGELFGGPMRTLLGSSNEAELCAIANALAALRKEGHLADVSLAMVQSDSTWALAMLVGSGAARLAPHRHSSVVNHPRGDLPLTSPTQRAAIEVIHQLIADTGVRLLARHVKGHRPGTRRGWVNQQCDRIAKQHMQARREGVNFRRSA